MRALACQSIVVVLLLVAAPAQVSTTAHLVGGNVQAGTTVAPMPVGATIGGSLVRSCAGSSGSSSFALGQVATLTELRLYQSAGCQAMTTGTATADATVRYDFTSPVPFVGRFVVEWNVTDSGTGTSALTVDLGADGTIEATGAAVLPVTFGPGTASLQVHVLCQAVAGGVTGPFGTGFAYQGAAAGNLLVRFEPAHSQAQVVGPTCGIPQFDARGTFLRHVELVGQPPATDEIAVLVLGWTSVGLTLPLPPGCPVLVDPMILEWQLLDPGDQAKWTLVLGPALLPVTFQAQLFGLDLHTFHVTGSHPLLVLWQ